MSKAEPKSTPVSESREQIVEDLQKLIADAQELAKGAKSATGEAIDDKVKAARDGLRQGVESLKEHGESARQKSVDCAKTIDEVVRENPWKSIGIAAAGGFLLSLLFRRD